ncbi:hypothetical protein GQ43DRAFT_443038 [Delitschia confertaspora ATCC 74209]|uniref:Uncharacterized protein n=1 Tax=Delitschia confertaspora ATCC 74209 TaxID=1513339 RepID=A0A9P4MT82_9PLEO|nr:hypothetical protein GQ43DRAFT_443038 [Delitschia confertaspora ATCC 74209]
MSTHPDPTPPPPPPPLASCWRRQPGKAVTYYGTLPAAALDPDSSDLRVDSIASRRLQKSKLSARWSSLKRKRDQSRPVILLNRLQDGTSSASSTSKDHRISSKKMAEVEIHQSTFLNLDAASQSELWVLPDFEEWGMESEIMECSSLAKQDEDRWGPLISRAVDSNRDRLRRRLEGDGWDFVGGKYGEDGEAFESETSSEGSVDEEFDVVVLEMYAEA